MGEAGVGLGRAKGWVLEGGNRRPDAPVMGWGWRSQAQAWPWWVGMNQPKGKMLPQPPCHPKGLNWVKESKTRVHQGARGAQCQGVPPQPIPAAPSRHRRRLCNQSTILPSCFLSGFLKPKKKQRAQHSKTPTDPKPPPHASRRPPPGSGGSGQAPAGARPRGSVEEGAVNHGELPSGESGGKTPRRWLRLEPPRARGLLGPRLSWGAPCVPASEAAKDATRPLGTAFGWRIQAPGQKVWGFARDRFPGALVPSGVYLAPG